MTIEKLQFSLPAVFTIGPEDEPDKLRKYAKILTGRPDDRDSRRQAATGRNHVQDIVKGIDPSSQSDPMGMPTNVVFGILGLIVNRHH